MTYQVLLNGVDISSRVLSIPSIHADDEWQGNLSANEASFELDNTDNYYTVSNLDIEGQTVEIYINGIKKFTGYAQKPRLNLRTKTVKVIAKDPMIKLMKKKCQDKIFVNTSLDDILLWLVSTVGGVSSYSLEATGKTVGFASYSITDKLIDRLQEAVDSVGGQMYFDENGTLIFKAGFASPFSTTTVGTLTVSKLSDLDFQFVPSKGNKVIVNSKSRVVSDEKEYVFTWSGTVPPEGLPDGKDDDGNPLANEQWKAKFDNPAIDIDSYAEVEWEADPDLALDQTTYDSNFDASGNLKYPDFMYLKITNSSNYERNVIKLGIQGRPIKDTNIEAIYQIGAGDIERRVSNDLVTGKTWAAQLAQWLCEEGNGRWQASIPVADFDFALSLKVGDKIDLVESSTGISHRVIVRSIDLKLPDATATITVINDRDAEFVYTPSSTDVISSSPSDTSEAGDGIAPSTPTGLALTSFYKNGKCYVKASWTASPENDIKGYEARWSYDNATWNHLGITLTEIVFEVAPGKTVYVQVRACDIEGFTSDWTASASITTQVDVIAPGAPGTITIIPGKSMIAVSWGSVSDEDLDYYEVQRKVADADEALVEDWTTKAKIKSTSWVDSELYKVDGVIQYDYKYYYRVRAVDLAGNASGWTVSTAGSPSLNSFDDLDVALTVRVGQILNIGGKVEIKRDTATGYGQIIIYDDDGSVILRIGESARYVDSAYVTFNWLGGTGTPETHMYSSTDGVTWTDEGIITSISQKDITSWLNTPTGLTYYLKFAEVSGLGDEGADFVVYVNGQNKYSGNFSLDENGESSVYSVSVTKYNGIYIAKGVLAGIIQLTGSLRSNTGYDFESDDEVTTTLGIDGNVSAAFRVAGDSTDILEIFGTEYYGMAGGLHVLGTSDDGDVAITRLLVDKIEMLIKPATGSFTQLGLLIPRYSSAPSTARSGAIYFNTTDNRFYGYNGSSWVVLG